MHKKSVEAAKALKEEDGGSLDGDGAADCSESGNLRRHQSLPLGSTASVDGSLDRGGGLLSSGRQSPGCGSKDRNGGAEDSLRSQSIAALRAKVTYRNFWVFCDLVGTFDVVDCRGVYPRGLGEQSPTFKKMGG